MRWCPPFRPPSLPNQRVERGVGSGGERMEEREENECVRYYVLGPADWVFVEMLGKEVGWRNRWGQVREKRREIGKDGRQGGKEVMDPRAPNMRIHACSGN